MVTKTLMNENLMNENVTLSNYAFNKNNPMKINFSENTSISSFSNKLGKHNNSHEQTSPYLNCTKVHIISKMTEKKIFQKKPNDVTSSFSQAYKIYKTSSDEFKSIKGKSKKDKSRLVVSKELTNGQQTVSDMNESEYHSRVDTNRKCKRKRRPAKKFGRPNLEDKKFEFYNGDLICTPAIKVDKKQFIQDKRINNNMQKINRTRKRGEIVRPGDLWTLLRSMNKFPYITSPRLSEDSIETIKRKGNYTKSQKETGLIETCTTEEFSYISSYDIKSKSQSICSKPSSFDRVTIVNRKGDSNFKELTKLPVANVRSSRISKKNTIKNRCNKQRAIKKNVQPADNSGIENKTETFLNCQPSGLFKNPYCGSRQGEIQDGYIELIDNTNTNSEDETLPEQKFECVQNDTSTEDNKYDSRVFLSSISSKAGLKNITDVKIIDKNKNTLDNKGNCMKENRFVPKQLLNNQKTYGFPKLTQTEIKRRLVNLKYPIIILGKDELSSTFRIVDYDPPQFNGLNRQVWPYMKEWIQDSKMNKLESRGNKVLENQVKNSVPAKHQNAPARNLNEMSNRKSVQNFTGNRMHSPASKKRESKTNIHLKEDPNKCAPQKKRVLNHFKDKMIDLIYNKPQKNLVSKSVSSNVNCNRSSILRPIKHNLESKVHLEPIRGVEYKELCDNTSHFNKPQPNKHPWSKAKWASDFIDNIIKKIKKGMYYTQHDIEHENISSGTEVIIPIPKVETIPEDENINQEVFTNDSENSTIPGFDDNHNLMPLKVDVKMITSTLVSVHHSLTNVMLQFDICIPSVSESALNSTLPSFSSVITPENKSMLYKCQDRIPNGMLPAQLCSILPKFISQIMKDKAFTDISNSPFNIQNNGNQIIPRIIFYPFMQFGSELRRIITGRFLKKERTNIVRNGFITWNSDRQKNNLIRKVETKRVINFSPTLRKYMKLHCQISNVTNEQTLVMKPYINTCTSMVPYIAPITTISRALGLNGFEKLISGINNFMIRVKRWNNTTFPFHNCRIDISDELRGVLNSMPKLPMHLSITDLPHERRNDLDSTIETRISKYDKGGHEVAKKCVKKAFVKLHKKCKSLTSMSKESCSTSLNKITNLDDFFHALGCYKPLSKVLVGHSDKAILSYISEMRSWIKEITQAQALLILLLSNKKETRNLKRFRPMLLQGIAVNRITTASELDMEIEEKENLCISQNEGISFLSQSNDNSLLDELCWIAKTTASDYQKPFDDSSEKLIKSLLGKRKKLNPSYLRVMARYVGLGLLKHRSS